MSDPEPIAHGHVPVMLSEVMQLLNPRPGETIVDATVGCGGHAEAIQRALGETGRLIGVDRDPAMAERARERLADTGHPATCVLNNSFSELNEILAGQACLADGILLDLGVASPQIDDGERGFSYRADGPLDMRMSPDGGSALDWINSAPEKEIADVLYQYGDERHSRRIARAVVRSRRETRIRRTVELAEIIRRAAPRGARRLHPARRSFQAIRIYINREMDHLERFLNILPGLLNTDGRCVVISYHSLEDRRVKNAFRDGKRAGQYDVLTRKPLRPSDAEVRANPRSRSARVRAIRRRSGGTE